MAKKASKKGLGRGFESLIPTEVLADDFGATAEADAQGSHTRPIKIQDIIPNPNQPRRNFDDEAMKELAESIATHGVLQPIVVVRDGARFKIIAGERRWRAVKGIGHDTIPAIVRTLDEQEKLELALIENLQREDLNPLEVAATLSKLIDQFNVSIDELSKRVGKAKPTVSNMVRLLQLPEPAKRALEKGRISEGHARAILMLSGDVKKQQQLLDYIIKNKWSVRQAEQFAAASKGTKTTEKGIKNTAITNKETEELTKKLKPSTPVKVHNMAKGRGRIIIEFKNKNEYKKLTKKLLS